MYRHLRKKEGAWSPWKQWQKSCGYGTPCHGGKVKCGRIGGWVLWAGCPLPARFAGVLRYALSMFSSPYRPAWPTTTGAALLVLNLVLAGCASAPAPLPAPRLSAEQASDIAMHALGLVGTPYRYGGNTPESGFDCSGLIGYVYQSRAGTPPPRTVAQLDRWGQPVDSAALRTGDLVVFGRGRTPSHAGIYVGEGRFVHAPSSGGTVRMDRLDARYWAQQNAAFRRP